MSVNQETGTIGSQAMVVQTGMIVAGDPIVMETVGVKQIFPMKK
jgi:MOSC domain-containing protein YiiM